ncbi:MULTISPECIES: hypothetical protein [unclassified Haladaptatus]|uniref:hypothetical protein n=1 Tax=unclassified Haladaptatus TaxID=2622732 RepID=UPI00209C69E2|nr:MULTISPECIES: hypothetical protein [unclassified Haladaptatus]MCO8243056.1 hypothetical protein [Haladaptatus sp. AB643]MCO8252770.1 hypothetical protein [Haladaptatus sp. AB618]
MSAREETFESIRQAVTEHDAGEPLTAREILELLDETDHSGGEFGSTHEIATVLGRRARAGDVRVIRSSPYRYEL